jgi:hypothetical protein
MSINNPNLYYAFRIKNLCSQKMLGVSVQTNDSLSRCWIDTDSLFSITE